MPRLLTTRKPTPPPAINFPVRPFSTPQEGPSHASLPPALPRTLPSLPRPPYRSPGRLVSTPRGHVMPLSPGTFTPVLSLNQLSTSCHCSPRLVVLPEGPVAPAMPARLLSCVLDSLHFNSSFFLADIDIIHSLSMYTPSLTPLYRPRCCSFL